MQRHTGNFLMNSTEPAMVHAAKDQTQSISSIWIWQFQYQCGCPPQPINNINAVHPKTLKPYVRLAVAVVGYVELQ